MSSKAHHYVKSMDLLIISFLCSLKKNSFRVVTWSANEDSILTEAVNTHGAVNWNLFASLLPGRTAKQSRERWHNHLSKGVKKGDWSAREDEIISETQKLIGNQWSKIAVLLNGRTDNDVKNRFHVIQRRKGEESAARIFRNQRKLQNQRNKKSHSCLMTSSLSKHIANGSVFTSWYSSEQNSSSSDISLSCHSTLSSDSMDSTDSMNSYQFGCSIDDYVVDQEILDILASDAHIDDFCNGNPDSNDCDIIEYLCNEYVLS